MQLRLSIRLLRGCQPFTKENWHSELVFILTKNSTYWVAFRQGEGMNLPVKLPAEMFSWNCYIRPLDLTLSDSALTLIRVTVCLIFSLTSVRNSPRAEISSLFNNQHAPEKVRSTEGQFNSDTLTLTAGRWQCTIWPYWYTDCENTSVLCCLVGTWL